MGRRGGKRKQYRGPLHATLYSIIDHRTCFPEGGHHGGLNEPPPTEEEHTRRRRAMSIIREYYMEQERLRRIRYARNREEYERRRKRIDESIARDREMELGKR